MADHARNPRVVTAATPRSCGSGPPSRSNTAFALPFGSAANASMSRFARSESGAVTADYMPIIAAVVGLGLAVASTVRGGLDSVSGEIGSTLTGYKISTSFDALKAIEDTAYLFEDTKKVEAEAEELSDSELAALLSDEEVSSLLEDVSGSDGSSDGTDDSSSTDSSSTDSADAPPSAVSGSGKSDKTSSGGSGKSESDSSSDSEKSSSGSSKETKSAGSSHDAEESGSSDTGESSDHSEEGSDSTSESGSDS